jgi:uncharacterized protein YceH (UPF0502 family)
MSNQLLLSPLETRVLGVLVEKKHTVPDTYPLSLNSLNAGCNQKTSRDPVMDASEADVLTALDALRGMSLVMESSGSRVVRYSHNMDRVLQIPSQSVAVVATLMLRGPQTPAELRANSERLYRFADVSSVEAFLDELAQRSAGALVMLLPRAPGSRESRWTHLLCGEPVISSQTVEQHGVVARGDDEVPTLRAELRRLDREVTELRAQLAHIYTELGLQRKENAAE